MDVCACLSLHEEACGALKGGGIACAEDGSCRRKGGEEGCSVLVVRVNIESGGGGGSTVWRGGLKMIEEGTTGGGREGNDGDVEGEGGV